MILEPEEAERFYRIWWPLLLYVNQRRQVASDLRRRAVDGALRIEQAVVIRDVLWRDDLLTTGLYCGESGASG